MQTQKKDLFSSRAPTRYSSRNQRYSSSRRKRPYKQALSVDKYYCTGKAAWLEVAWRNHRKQAKTQEIQAQKNELNWTD